MGIQPFLVASSVRLILAQRLVRKVCAKCSQVVTPHPEALVELGVDEKWAAGATIRKGEGCDSCNNSGFSGRLGLYEVMVITPEITQLILDKASTEELRQQARKDGMMTLREDGISKVAKGITSIDEILRETAAV